MSAQPRGETLVSAVDAVPLEADSGGHRRVSKADQVYDTLKGDILSGALPPGSAIDKPALCERLGVSRFPVGAAINRLAFEKLVVIEPQHGSFVSRISLAQVRAFMLIRRAIEGDVAAEAAQRGSTALAEALGRNLAEQAAAAAAADHTGFYRLDVAFHGIVVRALGLDHAADILDGLLVHLERVRRIRVTPSGRARHTLVEHRAIAAAIAAGDPEAARSAARSHLAQTSALFEDIARHNPALFAEADHA